jgi:hypothetical protein
MAGQAAGNDAVLGHSAEGIRRPIRGSGANAEPGTMKAVAASDRRSSPRQLINRVAQIRVGKNGRPLDCIITDMSAGGVRLHVEGFSVPNDFVLVLSDNGVAKECTYRVVWRLGPEVGASFIGLIR